MRPLVGWSLRGPSFTTRDAPSDAARVGQPTWGSGALLRDLELRLGLPSTEEADSGRVPRWVARIRAVGDANAFYAKSFAVDEIGTARTLLDWRDALVDAGWDGGDLSGAGDRLEALARIEAHDGPAGDALGSADRLRRVERELEATPGRLYESVTLIERRSSWPRRWQRIFERLEAAGTSFELEVPDLASADPSTDLGLLQSLMRGAPVERQVTGDGSIVLLRADTCAELAEIVASYLSEDERASDAVIVRSLDPITLERALRRHGLATQGHGEATPWRPAMQILPLALELAFAPRDPYRALELLTLPVGPFRGSVGAALSRAVAREPGIGGHEWSRQKEKLAVRLRSKQIAAGKSEVEADTYVAQRMAAVAEWFEAPSVGVDSAPRTSLVLVANRVKDWLQKRMGAPERDVYAPAYVQASAFAQALGNDERDVLTRVEARYLFDSLARGAHEHSLSFEEASRVPWVAHPSALLAPRDTVVAWGFVAGVERTVRRAPWNEDEQRALGERAVRFVDPRERLAIEAEAWRRVVLAARKRVVLVVPSSSKGDPKSAHPLWDEIRARLGLDDDASVARLTVSAKDVLEGRNTLARTTPVDALDLPEPRGEWIVAPELLERGAENETLSPTAFEELVSCPLRWVFSHRADLESGALAKVAGGPLLNGKLAHRLVEELHEAGAFALSEDAFREKARTVFDRLLEREGATLLLPGASFERIQLTTQVVAAMRELRRWLEASAFRIVAVEETVRAESALGVLEGRLDLRIEDAKGNPAILDLKWGTSSYRARLLEGRALQLAIYARGVRAVANEKVTPPAGYFSLSTGRSLAADARMKPSIAVEGPSLDLIISRADATALAVLASHTRGKVFVAGTKRSLPLLEALSIPEGQREKHFDARGTAACDYCPHDAICGRRWEEFA